MSDVERSTDPSGAPAGAARTAALVVAAALGYFVLAQLGLKLIARPEGVAAVWPAAGLAAGLALLWPDRRLWLFVAVAAATAVANLLAGRMPGSALIFALCNGAEAWLFGAVLAPRVAAGARVVRSPGVAALAGAAAWVSALAAALGASALQLAGGSHGSWASAFGMWFAADFVAILAFAPLFVAWSDPRSAAFGRREVLEALAWCAALAVLTVFVVAAPDNARTWLRLAAMALLFAAVHVMAARLPLRLALFGPPLLALLAPAALPGDVSDEDARLPALQVSLALLTTGLLVTGHFVQRLQSAVADQRAAGAGLQETQARLQVFIEHAPAAIAMFDDRMRYLATSRRWLLDFGLDDDIAGRSHYELFRDLPERWREAHRRALAGETLHADADAWTRADGSLRRLNWTLAPWRTADGAIGGILIAAEDVTASLHNVERLLEQQRQLQFAYEVGRIGSFEYDGAARSLRGSASFLQLHGLPEAAAPIALETWLARLHADDRARAQADLAQALASREAYRSEYRVVLPDGALRWLNARGEALDPEASGRPSRVFGAVVDVTERKRFEDTLRAQEERLRFALDATRTGVFDWDIETGTAVGSEWVLDILELPPGSEAPTYELWRRHVHPDDIERLEAALHYAIEHSEPYFAQYRIVSAHGRERWIEARGRAVREAGDGPARRMIGTLTDITDRKNAEIRLALAQDAGEAGFFEWHLPSGRAHVSGVLLRLPGVNPSTGEISVDDWRRLVHPDDEARVRALVADAAAQRRERVSYEFRLRTPGGERWFAADARISYGADGQPQALYGINHDVTHRRAAQEALVRQAALIDLSADAIIVRDGAGRIRFWSAGAERLYGWSAGEAVGRITHELLQTEYPAPLGEIQEELWMHGRWTGELIHARRDGSRIVVLSRWQLTRSLPGSPDDMVLMSNTDITQRRRDEEALRVSQERLHLAQTAGRAGFFEWDMESGRALLSGLLRDISNSNGETTLELWEQMVVPEDAAETQRIVAEAMARREQEVSYEFRVRTDEGERWLSAHAQIDYFDDGRPKSIFGINYDITERKLQEQALAAADEQKNRFLAVLSHELRNPLAPIRNAARLLTTPGIRPEQLRWAQGVIERQTGHMALLLEDLLDLARITQGKLQLRRERVMLRVVLESAIESARPLIDERRHTLAVHVPERLPPVDGDPLRLAQVFANLLTNAAKYTDPGGRIELSARLERGDVIVAVRDNGIGIAPAEAATIFEMFTQAAGTQGRSDGGLGIGLALIKGLVELHDGSIRVESAGPGQGAEFTVTLPTRAGAPRADAAAGQRAAPAPALSLRILVADDNVDAAESLAMLLRLSHHEVRVTYDGQQAIEAAREFRPDVAILDIGMPRLDGYAVARMIRAEEWGRQVTLIALTGRGQAGDRRASVASGFEHHFMKPVEPEAIEELLAGLRQPHSRPA